MNKTPRSKRGRPQTLDTEKVLNVAMNAYWKGDPADVSVNAICGMAEASKPAIYRAFGNEDGLMLAALNHYADGVLFDIFQILTPERSLKETLNALIHFSSQDPKMETGCLFYKMRAGKHRLGPQTLQRINEIDAVAVDTSRPISKNVAHQGNGKAKCLPVRWRDTWWNRLVLRLPSVRPVKTTLKRNNLCRLPFRSSSNSGFSHYVNGPPMLWSVPT